MTNAHSAVATAETDIEHYRGELERSPDDPSAHNNLGVMRARQGDPGAAIGYFDEALLLDPDHLNARMNRGSALVALGRHGEAVTVGESGSSPAKPPCGAGCLRRGAATAWISR